MKTPFAVELKLEDLIEGKFDERINEVCLDKTSIEQILSLFQNLSEPIKLTLKPEDFTFAYFFNLIQLLKSESINFTFEQDFIKAANNFFISKGGDGAFIYSEVIHYKIIIELIYNFRKFVQNDIVKAKPENVKDKNSIAYIEKYINKKYKSLYEKNINVRQKLNLPENLFDLDLAKVRSLLLINSIRDKKPSNYNDMYDKENSLNIYYSYLDEETINKIKSIINEPSFMKDFLITKENYSDENKINFLYFLLNDILDKPKVLEGFSFLIKTRQILSELLKNKNKKQLLAEADIAKGAKDRLGKILDILLPNDAKNIQDEKKDNNENSYINDKSTNKNSQSYSYLKIVQAKKKKKVKDRKYISFTVFRERPDTPYEDIELLKLAERSETLSEYLNGIWKYGVLCYKSLKNMREKFFPF